MLVFLSEKMNQITYMIEITDQLIQLFSEDTISILNKANIVPQISKFINSIAMNILPLNIMFMPTLIIQKSLTLAHNEMEKLSLSH